MRSIIAITLVLCVASIALADNEQADYANAGDILADSSGNLRLSNWAGWSHDGTSWVARFPAGTWSNNSHYGNSWELNTFQTFGGGYNGTIYYTNPALAPNPAGTWDVGYEYGDYTSKAFLSFDISGLTSGAGIHLRMIQGGWGSSGLPTQSGMIYRMTTTPVDPTLQGANWNHSDSQEDPNTGTPGAGAVTWATPGGDYDVPGGVAYTSDTIIRRVDGGPNNTTPQMWANMGAIDWYDVSSLVQDAIDASEDRITLIMVVDGDADFNAANDYGQDWSSHRNTFGVSEVGTVMSPALTIVPEPATMGLLAIGGLALLRRRRR